VPENPIRVCNRQITRLNVDDERIKRPAELDAPQRSQTQNEQSGGASHGAPLLGEKAQRCHPVPLLVAGRRIMPNHIPFGKHSPNRNVFD
jgi:hypothetical protein